jgi:3-oxoacyl-[acyl-carrier-protein] synthase II
MIPVDRTSQLPDDQRVVITGIGLTSPNGYNLEMFRESLLAGKSGVQKYNIRYVGDTLAGVCEFETTKYQSKRDMRRGNLGGF